MPPAAQSTWTECTGTRRTGAGKSTLMVALFRLVEPASGAIRVDGVDLLHLGLARARQATTIIPQEPILVRAADRSGSKRGPVAGPVARLLEIQCMQARWHACWRSDACRPGGTPVGDPMQIRRPPSLARAHRPPLALGPAALTSRPSCATWQFKGTVAHNLDPFGQATAERHRDVIARARLSSAMLGVEVDKGGTNLSAGERQLLCFARALLHPRRLLVLDEATSNLDRTSDDAIQALLRSEFRETTLLTIAHRLGTIIDYHTILVMGAGKVLEQGAPADLLRQPKGVLAGLAGALGAAEFESLKRRATAATPAAVPSEAAAKNVEPTLSMHVAMGSLA